MISEKLEKLLEVGIPKDLKRQIIDAINEHTDDIRKDRSEEMLAIKYIKTVVDKTLD